MGYTVPLHINDVEELLEEQEIISSSNDEESIESEAESEQHTYEVD